MSAKKPFIFVAFAKEVNELSENLTAVLKKGEQSGIYTVKIEHEATSDKLDKMLESSTIFNEVDIFHYINNQDTSTLEVEQESLENRQAFLEYLIQSTHPKVVVFEDLMDDKIAQTINDQTIPLLINIWNSQKEEEQENSNFSLYFYTKLIDGEYLNEAFNYASDKVVLQERFKTVESKLHVRSGSEPLLSWKLSTAPASPEISKKVELALPENPFPLFEAYTLADTGAFFARQEEVNDLFYRIHDQNSASIILLYGESGIGKTSLVQAGLTPFLLNTHHVLCIEMPRKKTVLTALYRATEHPESAISLKIESIDTDSGTISTPELMPKDLADFWELEEQANQNPMVLILDQAENIFSKNEEQIAHFFEELSQNFNFHHPKGKLILVSSKSNCIDFEEQFEKYKLSYDKIALNPLSKEGIIDFLTKVKENEDFHIAYRLEIETHLPELIGNKISELPNEERAFSLQILLNKMWHAAKEINPATVKFTIPLFKECFQNGVGLESFLTEQIEKLHKWNPEIAKSGLAIDILKTYISDKGQSIECSGEQVEERYKHTKKNANKTIWKLQELGLLGARKDNPLITHLSNKALIPYIEEIYQKSAKTTQISQKILKNRGLSLKNTSGNSIFLSKNELELIKNSRPFMGQLNPKDESLIEQSKKELKREKRIRGRKGFWRKTLIFILFLAVVGMSLAWYMEYDSHGKNRTKLQSIKASFLAYIAYQFQEEDPTKSLRVAEMACQTKSSKNDLASIEARKALFKAYFNTEFYYLADIKQNNKEILLSEFSPDGESMLVSWQGGLTSIVGRDGEEISTVKTGKEKLSAAIFSPDGTLLVGGFEEGNIKIWDLLNNAKIKGQFKAHQQAITSITFLKNKEHFITTSADSLIKLWNVKGKLLQSFEGTRQTVNEIVLSPDEKLIASISADTLVAIWDKTGQLLSTYHAQSISFSDNEGKLNLLTLVQDSMTIWEWGSNKIVKKSQNIASAKYSSDGKSILLVSKDKIASIKNIESQKIDTLNNEGESILEVGFSPNGNRLFVLNQERKVRILSSELEPLGFVQLTNETVEKIKFSDDGKSIFTQNQRNAYLWDCTSKAAWTWQTKDSKSSFSADGNYVLSYQKGSKKLQLWNSLSQSSQTFTASGDIENAYFLQGNRHVYVQNSSDYLELWDFKKNKSKKFPKNDDKLQKIVFSDTANYVLRFYQDNQVVLGGKNDKELQKFTIKDAEFVPNSNKLLTLSEKGNVICLNLGSKKDTLQQFKGAGYIAWYLSPDGTHLGLTKDHKAFTILNVKDGSKVASISTEREAELVFSPDNEKVLFRKRIKKATKDYFQWVDFKNLKHGRNMKPISLPSAMEILEFTENSKYILMGNAKSSKLIDLSRGERKIGFSAKSPFYLPKQAIFIGLSQETVKIKSFDQGDATELVKFRKKGLKDIALSANGDWLMLKFDNRTEVYPQSIQKISDWMKKRAIYELSDSDKIKYGIDDIME